MTSRRDFIRRGSLWVLGATVLAPEMIERLTWQRSLFSGADFARDPLRQTIIFDRCVFVDRRSTPGGDGTTPFWTGPTRAFPSLREALERSTGAFTIEIASGHVETSSVVLPSRLRDTVATVIHNYNLTRGVA